MRDDGTGLGVVLTLAMAVLFLVGACWWAYAAPCWMHAGDPIKDLPARCYEVRP